MKKNLAVLFAVLMLALAGCSGGKEPSGSGAPSSDPTATPTVEPTEEPKSGHVVDYKLDVPDGFELIEQEGLDACWYRADGSNINLLVSPKDSTTDLGFQMITADILRVTLVEQMKAAYGLEPEINDRYFTKDDVCGLTAYQYSYVMDLDGQAMMQIIVCVNADEMYTFTFTAIDEDTLAAFDECAKNIQLILE